MLHKLLSLLACLIVLLPLSLHAEKWSSETIPVVHLSDATKYVVNPDHVLSSATTDSIDSMLYQLEQAKGVQTVVVVVKQLAGNDPYQFGIELSQKYGIGGKQTNTGLIFVIATEDRNYQILTGRGLEGTLPDAICKRIENRILVPRLKQSDWDGGTLQTVAALDRIIRGDTTIQALNADDDYADAAIVGLILAFIFGGAFIFIVIVISAQSKCPQCQKAHLRAIHRQRIKGNRLSGNKMRITYRCPRCGYEKEVTYTDFNNNGGAATPIIGGFPIGRGHASGSFGSGSFGGSFGGGSFGGGGAGGSF